MTPLYPYSGEWREDTVAQPFRDEVYATLVAMILERMTGERCKVLTAHHSQRVLRCSGEKWMKV